MTQSDPSANAPAATTGAGSGALDPADILRPVNSWFASQGWDAFAFQRETWAAYLNGASGLVHAPTGMGKTYAVWLGPLAEALANPVSSSKAETVPSRLRAIWITPLRALANDTAANLDIAVRGLGLDWKVELRTGDTSSSVRARQRKQLPEALVTTPESLSLLLSYPGCNEQFAGLKVAIIDEWHELLSSKRGVQAELALARLRRLSPRLRTWGLSATLGNLQQAMHVLLGSKHERGRLICGEIPKTTLVETLRPESVERFPWAGHLGLSLLPEVIRSIEQARTTLIFTNVRSQAEIWFQQIMKARPDLIGQVALHHGSLDRDIRSQVENLLREGRVKCVVCTSSLDLGVDFTPVDQVMQIGSPKGIARMMQRAGRSGHQPGAASRIIGVPTNSLELVEFAAAREAAAARRIESRDPIDRPLDVLAQHMVTLACGDGFDAANLLEEVRETHAYAKLTDQEWTWAMDFVSQGGPALTAYPQYARIIHDPEGLHVIASPRLQRLHRMTIGTITSDAAVKVAFTGGATLGTIEESFISRLAPGDRFVFAGRVLELVRFRNLVAHVRKARQASGIIPRWGGGRSPLSTLLSHAIRRKLDEAREGIFNSPEMEVVRPLLELQGQWSRIPKPDEMLVERVKSRDGWHVFFFPFEGRLVHDGLSSLVAHRVASLGPRSMQVTANDYGFELLSPDPIELDEDEWRQAFTTDDLVRDLLACLNTTALARRQFREIARVAGLVFPGFPGQGKTARQLQASTELFYQVFTEFDPGNLLLEQARREVLDRELEVVRLRGTLERIRQSRMVIVDLDHFTPLSFPIWVERIRTQHVTSEKWADRIRRMAMQLEDEASGRSSGKTRRKRAKA